MPKSKAGWELNNQNRLVPSYIIEAIPRIQAMVQNASCEIDRRHQNHIPASWTNVKSSMIVNCWRKTKILPNAEEAINLNQISSVEISELQNSIDALNLKDPITAN
nr:2272_t:CDS:2 [Entrophospora candida]